jgi:MoxR-like ATPase
MNMNIQAIKFDQYTEQPQGRTCELRVDGEADLMALLGEAPVTYVIKSNDLSAISQYKDTLEKCTNQSNRAELSRGMLGHAKIAIKLAEYKGINTLKKAAADLLKKHAEYEPEKTRELGESGQPEKGAGVFIVGVENALFGKLWDDTAASERLEEEAKLEKKIHQWKGPLPKHGNFYSATLRLMNCGLAPEELRKTYLGEAVEIEFVRQRILQVAASEDPVLISGDTGTGKEIVAREIHKYSSRKDKGDISPINCAAIPSKLLESELFGHEKGAFTGADKQKKGLWETVGDGTLFLDEIGDLSLDHQAKVLRALQENKIRRVGGEKEIPVNARVVAASNRNLAAMVKAEQFREDLLYRIRKLFIPTPPLRAHLEDVPLLAKTFWKKIATNAPPLPDEILVELQNYRWPGNVRELKGVLSDLISLFRDSKRPLGVEHLRAVFRLNGQVPFSDAHPKSEAVRSMECLIHLSKVYDTIRAARFVMEPLIKGKNMDPDTAFSVYVQLNYRLDELEVLCRHPERFHNPSAFDSINMLKSRFTYFQSLMDQDIEKALNFWKESGTEAFDQAVRELKKATELLRESP